MFLHELKPPVGAKKNRKRVGRGPGSGHGTYSCRGLKGQGSRTSGNVRPGFEGGQMPIHRRLPKRGFFNLSRKVYAIVNLGQLNKFERDTVVSEKELVMAGLVKGKREGIKLLGKGEINYPLIIKVNKVSQSAKSKIENVGGRVEVIE